MDYAATHRRVLEQGYARRQARREVARSVLGAVAAGTRSAQSLQDFWALHRQDADQAGIAIGQQHPGHAAILAVRNALAELSLPEYQPRWLGTRRASGYGQHGTHEGQVDIEVAFTSLSGVRDAVVVPVQIHAGRVYEPGTVIHGGIAHVICQPTFDAILARNTLHTHLPTRTTMYGRPPDGPPRAPVRVPLVRPGLFSVPAAPRRAALDIAPGDAVKVTTALTVAGRDGYRWRLAPGTEGHVQSDLAGDGTAYWIYLPQMGATLRLPGSALARA